MPEEPISCVSTGSAKEHNTEKKIPPVKMRIMLFFDGTCNNRSNTAYRKALETGIKDKAKQDEVVKKLSDSYKNDESNVAKLERLLLKVQSKNAAYNVDCSGLYVEGIGTTNLKEDTTLGGAVGMGETGIVKKVEKGLAFAIKEIRSKANQEKKFDLITIDVFGFSRGAAAARHFIHLALVDAQKKITQQLGSSYSIAKLEVKFAGLFDTVSHYGVKMGDDVGDLHLDAVKKAETACHLCAGDEFRHNFPLINIKSKGSTEVQLPGVHSDIGGSYPDEMNELNLLVLVAANPFRFESTVLERYKKEKEWLIGQGWFKDVPEEINDQGTKITLNRYNISNAYANIPLVVMKNHAEKTQLAFNAGHKTFLIAKYAIDNSPTLTEVMSKIGALGTNAWNWNTHPAPSLVKDLRHKYCHFNATYGGGGWSASVEYIGGVRDADVNAPEWDSTDFKTQVRKRVVYNG